MVFSSTTFLFAFLPLALAAYYAAGKRFRSLVLAGSSLLFYGWANPLFTLLMLFSTVVDYSIGLFMVRGRALHADGGLAALDKETPRTAAQKRALWLSIATNLGLLAFFKYFNFGVDNVNAVANALGIEWLVSEDVMQITLPLGISFYTFQSLSYTIDVYRGETKASRNFLDFACFVTLFPQLVAGPIVRYRDIAEQMRERTVSRNDFVEGVTRFVLGLGKKVLVANTVAIAADDIFALPTSELTPGLAWLGVLAYTLQIYFDFSAYSDMAIGLGRMFGFHLLENFNYPYIASSVQEFWRRWHMSLSTWFRDYLYIPLGGNRGSKGRTYFNLFAVFFLCGLWHGASWTFVAWGLLHGAFLVIERLGLAQGLQRCPKLVGHAYTLLVVMVGWVLFRAETFAQASAFLSAMAGFAPGSGGVYFVGLYLNRELAWTIVLALLFATPVLPAFRARARAWFEGASMPLVATEQVVRLSFLSLMFLACVVSLAAGTHNPFIYFRF